VESSAGRSPHQGERKDGAVTLSGSVPTYLEKTRALTTTEQVNGVKAVADDIEVHLHESHEKADSDIASSISHILEWNSGLAARARGITHPAGNERLKSQVEEVRQMSCRRQCVRRLPDGRRQTRFIDVEAIRSKAERMVLLL
jgi:hypothetical protein